MQPNLQTGRLIVQSNKRSFNNGQQSVKSGDKNILTIEFGRVLYPCDFNNYGGMLCEHK